MKALGIDPGRSGALAIAELTGGVATLADAIDMPAVGRGARMIETLARIEAPHFTAGIVSGTTLASWPAGRDTVRARLAAFPFRLPPPPHVVGHVAGAMPVPVRLAMAVSRARLGGVNRHGLGLGRPGGRLGGNALGGVNIGLAPALPQQLGPRRRQRPDPATGAGAVEILEPGRGCDVRGLRRPLRLELGERGLRHRALVLVGVRLTVGHGPDLGELLLVFLVQVAIHLLGGDAVDLAPPAHVDVPDRAVDDGEQFSPVVGAPGPGAARAIRSRPGQSCRSPGPGTTPIPWPPRCRGGANGWNG